MHRYLWVLDSQIVEWEAEPLTNSTPVEPSPSLVSGDTRSTFKSRLKTRLRLLGPWCIELPHLLFPLHLYTFMFLYQHGFCLVTLCFLVWCVPTDQHCPNCCLTPTNTKKTFFVLDLTDLCKRFRAANQTHTHWPLAQSEHLLNDQMS